MEQLIRVIDSSGIETEKSLSDISPTYWDLATETIAAGNTEVVITKTLADVEGMKLIVNITRSGGGKAEQFQYGLVKDDGVLKSSVYNKIGRLKRRIIESINGSNLEISIQNNETFDFEVQISFITF